MESCIVRQPILNAERQIVAYEVLYQAGSHLSSEQLEANAANAIYDFFMDLDQTQFLGYKDAFLTFPPTLLIEQIPNIFSTEKLVIQIEDSTLVNPMAKKAVYEYKSKGYRIALVGFEFSPRFLGILDAVDIIKVDFTVPDNPLIVNIVNIAKQFNKKIAAYNINTYNAAQKAAELNVDYMQGQNIAELVPTKIYRMDHLKSNFFQLMVAVTKEEPDLDEIAGIISKDVTLSYRLLKMINSAYFALKNRVTSVKQALTIWGLAQIKQWIYLLSFDHEDGGISMELIRISFLRASLCEMLSKMIRNFPITSSEAYLLGMFSTLGDLMQIPESDALEQLPISDELKKGLLCEDTVCGGLLRLVLEYEKANWGKVRHEAEQLGLELDQISKSYIECTEEVDKIWNQITHTVSSASDE